MSFFKQIFFYLTQSETTVNHCFYEVESSHEHTFPQVPQFSPAYNTNRVANGGQCRLKLTIAAAISDVRTREKREQRMQKAGGEGGNN